MKNTFDSEIQSFLISNELLKINILNGTVKNDQSKPVFRHFNSSNHSISDFVLCLSVINGGNGRKIKEIPLIHTLGTLSPHGINERLTYC